MRNKNPNFTYEPEDDVLNIWLSKKPIDFAEQSGNLIVHFTENNEPVYIEILDASKFLKKAASALPRLVKESLFTSPSSPSIAHRTK